MRHPKLHRVVMLRQDKHIILREFEYPKIPNKYDFDSSLSESEDIVSVVQEKVCQKLTIQNLHLKSDREF